MSERESEDRGYEWPEAEITNTTRRAYEPLPLEEEWDGARAFVTSVTIFFGMLAVAALLWLWL